MTTFIIDNETNTLLSKVDCYIPITDYVVIKDVTYKVICTYMDLDMLAQPLLKILVKL